MRSLASVFKALSDETRLQMLGLLLREGELCVCDFVEVLSVTQSKASRHLRYLVNAGLLQDRRAGIWVHFRVADEPAPAQAAVLDSLREYLPRQVPAELTSALKSWRKCKPKGGVTCAPLAARVGGSRA
jgi:ArsR family transcriptional regulator, arsenate/arsenite/antimonite-responsive transcriptional repressor